jgi:hypothetical protein
MVCYVSVEKGNPGFEIVFEDEKELATQRKVQSAGKAEIFHVQSS